jgi:hypothetical protein
MAFVQVVRISRVKSMLVGFVKPCVAALSWLLGALNTGLAA